MKTLVWVAPRTMEMHDQTQPESAAGEVLIKVGYAGICGSELSGYLGHNALRVPPLVMGHEFAGEIITLGANAATINPQLEIGQRVTVNPLGYCGECSYCQRGLNQLCVKRQLLGAHRAGAFAEYISVPAELVSVLPDGMSTRTGALTEPVAVAVRIAELAGNIAGQDCLVIGAGPIGLLAMQILQLRGAARIFIAELDPHRLAMGKDLGAITINPRENNTVQFVREMTQNQGVAVSVDAVGSAATRAQCVQATMTTGTLILSGLHEETSSLPAAEIIRREITLRGSFAYSPANFSEAIQLLADDKVRLAPWIVEAPLAEGGQWFDRLIEEPGNVSKVLLVP